MTVEEARANLRNHNLSDENVAAIEALIDAKIAGDTSEAETEEPVTAGKKRKKSS